MKILIFFIFMAALSPFTILANDIDARMKEAYRYESLWPLKEMVRQNLHAQNNANTSIKMKEELINEILNLPEMHTLRSDYIRIMGESLSLRELKALNAFYSSDEGQGILKKMPEINRKVEQSSSDLVRRGMRSYYEKNKYKLEGTGLHK